MKIVAISDIHGYLPNDLPEGDVLCICGDIVPLDYQSNFTKSVAWFELDFVPWSDSLNYQKIIFIAGNHDFFLEKISMTMESHYMDSKVLKWLLPDSHQSEHKLVYLQDSWVEIDSVRFYGTPWVPYLTNWAFYKSSEDLVKTFSKIPKNVDVLISHTPPRVWELGKVLQPSYSFGKDFGCKELADAISERNIKWSICGHVHSGEHNVVEFDDTKFSNVSTKDEDYHIYYPPFIFDV